MVIKLISLKSILFFCIFYKFSSHTLLLFFFNQISAGDFQSPEEWYLAFFQELTLLTARLVASWQCVGFCHG